MHYIKYSDGVTLGYGADELTIYGKKPQQQTHRHTCTVKCYYTCKRLTVMIPQLSWPDSVYMASLSQCYGKYEWYVSYSILKAVTWKY